MPQTPNISLLTEREAAQLLRLSERTLQRYRSTGEGPRWHRIGPKKITYSEADLVAWAERARFSSLASEARTAA